MTSFRATSRTRLLRFAAVAVLAALLGVVAAAPSVRERLAGNVQLTVRVLPADPAAALLVRADIAGKGKQGGGDGRIDALDLGAWLAAYRGGTVTRADVNGDGRVDAADLSVLLAFLGRTVD